MGIYPENAGLNAIFWMPTMIEDPKGTDPHENVLKFAAEVRKSVRRLKDSEFVKDMASGLAKKLDEVSWQKKGQDLLTALEGDMMVNNLWK
jgi:hypothetical protein